MKKQILLVIIVSFLASSCVANKAQQGTVGGAAGGALLGQMIGKDTEGTLIGAAVGALLGYMVGNEMDKADRVRMNDAFEYNPTNSSSSWVNPDSGNSYTVTPQRTYTERQTNRDCREAEILTTIDGKAEKTYTTACRDQSGRWVLQ
ncbi:MAG: glycine zipper 2TM domain-containing protein [Desulfobulbaceae bacterium]|nr:glycine zipper 2TM domain-containing protein [Desulfobulbaceae bacterium]